MKLNGKTVVVTGKVSIPRTSFQALVREHGGIVGTSVTRSTDILVTGDVRGGIQGDISHKFIAACKNGTHVMSEQQFRSLIGA